MTPAYDERADAAARDREDGRRGHRAHSRMDSIAMKRLAMLLAAASPRLRSRSRRAAQPAAATAAAAGEAGARTAGSRSRGRSRACNELEQRLQKVEDELAGKPRTTTRYLEEKLDRAAAAAGKIRRLPRPRRVRDDRQRRRHAHATVGHLLFPEYVVRARARGCSMGDPLSTAVNSRGDVADTGESRAIVVRSDQLARQVDVARQRAQPGAVLWHRRDRAAQRERRLRAARARHLGSRRAVRRRLPRRQARVRRVAAAASRRSTSTLQAGKFDSVLGFEYRSLESPDRIGITPSLICRYTCGRPIGAQGARAVPRRGARSPTSRSRTAATSPRAFRSRTRPTRTR